MNIGIDFDGVINTNNATAMKKIEDAIARKLGYELSMPGAKNSQERYGFNNKDYAKYQALRHDYINAPQFFASMTMMTGADKAITELNDLGHATYLVTVRGNDREGVPDVVARECIFQLTKTWGLLERGLIIDKNYTFGDHAGRQTDKLTQCQQLGIELLIDDDERNVKKMRQSNKMAIHFGPEAHTWDEVIRLVHKLARQ